LPWIDPLQTRFRLATGLLGGLARRALSPSLKDAVHDPSRRGFRVRNRLIAASTVSTLVVEAGWRSGSLNIAGHAIALGRPLGAVPGPVTSAASAGCHRLIREFGATLVTTTDEAADL